MVVRTLVRPDVAASPPTSSAYALVVRIAGLAPLMGVGSTSFRVSNSTAQRIPVSLSSTQQIIVGEVEIKNDSGNPVPVTDSKLDITLSALRNALTAGATLDTIVTGLAAMYARQADGTQTTVLAAGAATIGKVDQGAAGAAAWPVKSTGVKLSAGSATIGVVDQGAAGAGSWPVKSTSVKLAAGAAVIGGVTQSGAWVFTSTSMKIANPTTAVRVTNALLAVTSTSVKLAAGSAAIGTVTSTGVKLSAGAAAIGTVTSTSVKLAAGAATIGKVDQGAAGAASWPFTSTSVKLAAGAATVGKVDQGAAGAASWPVTSTSMKLAAGAATIGKVDQGAAGAASWPVVSTSVKLAAGSALIGKVTSTSMLVSNSTSSRVPVRSAQDGAPWSVTSTATKLAAGAATIGTVVIDAGSLAALEAITVQNATGASVPTAEQNCLVPKKFGCILLTYSTFVGSTSRKLTSAVYKTGSSTTATVATLTLAYSTLLQLASVART